MEEYLYQLYIQFQKQGLKSKIIFQMHDSIIIDVVLEEYDIVNKIIEEFNIFEKELT